MIGHLFFYIGLSFLLMHELDAVRCSEWRIFPGLSRLDDKLGFRIFAIAHIPLLFFLFWGLIVPENNESLIRWLDIFFILHFGLHILFLRHKNNEFKGRISWTLISGAGIFGLLDLLV